MNPRPHVHLAPRAFLLALLASGSFPLCAQTWDGGGANDNWGTADNWNPNATPSSGANVTFAGATRLNVGNISWGTAVQSITFSSGAGAFTLSGGKLDVGSGGVVNNSSNTQTIASRIDFTANQTWNANTGAIVSTASYQTADNRNLTLSGSHGISFNYLTNVGTLTLTGSGNRTFSSTDQLSATTVQVNNTGVNTFAGQVSATTLNLTAGTSNFTSTGTSAQVGSGGVNIGGTANASFSGNVGASSGGITISTSGNVTFGAQITNGGAYSQSSGNVTFTGVGDNYFSSFNLTGGSLHLDKGGGDWAVDTGQMNISNATLTFGESNQFNSSWTDITLGDGAVLQLGDTTQSIDNLVITGDAIIDFGTGGSTFDIDSISFGTGSSLTIVNWNGAVDHFYADLAPGSALPEVIFADTGSSGTWGSGAITPGAPVPEPSTYGFLTLGALGLTALWRRDRVRA